MIQTVLLLKYHSTYIRIFLFLFLIYCIFKICNPKSDIDKIIYHKTTDVLIKNKLKETQNLNFSKPQIHLISYLLNSFSSKTFH